MSGQVDAGPGQRGLVPPEQDPKFTGGNARPPGQYMPGQYAPGQQLPGQQYQTAVPYGAAPFQTGLFDCCEDTSSCFEGCFCHWCLAARLYNMATTLKPDVGWFCCCIMFLGDAAGLCGSRIGACYARSEARDKFGIQGADLCENLKAICCPYCSTCQVYREMSLRRFWPGGTCCISAPYVRKMS